MHQNAPIADSVAGSIRRRAIITIIVFIHGYALLLGCDRREAPNSSDAVSATVSADRTPGQERTEDPLAAARRLLQLGDLDGAAAAASKILVRDPQNADAALIAAQVESKRGNHRLVVDLASGIAIDSRLATQAIQLHYRALIRLGRNASAASVLLGGFPNMRKSCSGDMTRGNC